MLPMGLLPLQLKNAVVFLSIATVAGLSFMYMYQKAKINSLEAAVQEAERDLSKQTAISEEYLETLNSANTDIKKLTELLKSAKALSKHNELKLKSLTSRLNSIDTSSPEAESRINQEFQNILSCIENKTGNGESVCKSEN